LFYEIISALGEALSPYDGLGREQVVQRYAERKFLSLEDINPQAAYAALIIKKCWHNEYTSIQELTYDLPPLSVAFVILSKTCADLE
jgi:hypothetical protein